VVVALYKKKRSVKLFGYFRLPRGLSRRTRHCRSRAGTRHGLCELTARHGRGTAWARNAMCESAFSVPVLGSVHGGWGMLGRRPSSGTALPWLSHPALNGGVCWSSEN